MYGIRYGVVHKEFLARNRAYFVKYVVPTGWGGDYEVRYMISYTQVY